MVFRLWQGKRWYLQVSNWVGRALAGTAETAWMSVLEMDPLPMQEATGGAPFDALWRRLRARL